MRTEEKDPQRRLEENIEEAGRLLRSLRPLGDELETAAAWIIDCLAQGGTILTCGNGGSAAEAGHLSTELVSRFDGDRAPFAAINLSAHGGDLTAIGNDYNFAEVFSRQVDAYGRAGDVLLAFSTSGSSENVFRALKQAKARRMRTIAFLGGNGEPCRYAADLVLLVEGETTARIQECHQFLLHTLCELIDPSLKAMTTPWREQDKTARAINQENL